MTNDACDKGDVDLCDDDEPENMISDHSARLVECGLSSRLVECGLSSRLVECGLSSRLVECGLSPRLVECGLSSRLVECGLSSRLVECGLSSRLVECGLSSRLVECGLSSRLVECGLSSRLVECDLSSRRVSVVQSPVLYTFYQHTMALTLDTDATTNMIPASTAPLYHLPINPASQIVRQVDSVNTLDVIGEVHCNITRVHLSFQLDALVVKHLNVDVLAGNFCLFRNDIAVCPYKKIIIGDAYSVHYGTEGGETSLPSVMRKQAFSLRNL